MSDTPTYTERERERERAREKPGDIGRDIKIERAGEREISRDRESQ